MGSTLPRGNRKDSTQHENKNLGTHETLGITRQIWPGAGEGRAVRRDGGSAGGAPADAQLWQQAGGRWRL